MQNENVYTCGRTKYRTNREMVIEIERFDDKLDDRRQSIVYI